MKSEASQRESELVKQPQKPCHALLIEAGVRLHQFLAVLGGFFFHLGKGLGHFFIVEHVRRIREKYAASGRPARTKHDLFVRAVEDGLLDADFPAP